MLNGNPQGDIVHHRMLRNIQN